jgi:hypothetical protein
MRTVNLFVLNLLSAMRAHAGWIFLALAFVVNLNRAARELELPLVNTYAHAHRQTQTALGIRQYAEEGFTLLHEIPTHGEPWVVPMEFPVYQWAAAFVVDRTGWSIEKTGRIFSLMVFYATIPLLIWLLTFLDRTPQQASCIAAMVLISPTYQFWGRTVMIESTALFFAIGYVVTSISSLRDDGDRPIRTSMLAIALLFGILAALVKITTFAVAFGFLVLVVAVKFLQRDIDLRDRRFALSGLVSVTLVSIICGKLWVDYSDQIKATGIVTRYATSEGLQKWNYGTLALRFTAEYWRRFWEYGVQEAMPAFQFLHLGPDRWVWVFHPVSIVAFVLCVVWCLIQERKNILIFFVFLLAFVSGPLVFANLYFVHTYYWYANLWLLIVGIFYIIWDPRVWKRALEPFRSDASYVSIAKRLATMSMMLIAIGLGVVTIGAWKFHEYSDWQAFEKLRSQDKEALNAMRLLTAELPKDVDRKGVYLFATAEATPVVPYFLRRRTLFVRMTPPDLNEGNPNIAEAISLQQKGYRIEGLVELFPKESVDPEVRKSILKSLSLEEVHELYNTDAFRCTLLKKM